MERKWWTLLVSCIAIFMLLLDVTIVNVALPSIERLDLDQSVTLPRNGYFFRAESVFNVAEFIDSATLTWTRPNTPGVASIRGRRLRAVLALTTERHGLQTGSDQSVFVPGRDPREDTRRK